MPFHGFHTIIIVKQKSQLQKPKEIYENSSECGVAHCIPEGFIQNPD